MLSASTCPGFVLCDAREPLVQAAAADRVAELMFDLDHGPRGVQRGEDCDEGMCTGVTADDHFWLWRGVLQADGDSGRLP